MLTRYITCGVILVVVDVGPHLLHSPSFRYPSAISPCLIYLVFFAAAIIGKPRHIPTNDATEADTGGGDTSRGKHDFSLRCPRTLHALAGTIFGIYRRPTYVAPSICWAFYTTGPTTRLGFEHSLLLNIQADFPYYRATPFRIFAVFRGPEQCSELTFPHARSPSPCTYLPYHMPLSPRWW